MLAPLTASYVAANAFVLLFSFYPPDRQPNVKRSSQIFSALIGPIAGHCVLALGVLLWLWDLYILPRLGYIFEVDEERVFSEMWGTEILRVHYSVGWPIFRTYFHYVLFKLCCESLLICLKRTLKNPVLRAFKIIQPVLRMWKRATRKD